MSRTLFVLFCYAKKWLHRLTIYHIETLIKGFFGAGPTKSDEEMLKKVASACISQVSLVLCKDYAPLLYGFFFHK